MPDLLPALDAEIRALGPRTLDPRRERPASLVELADTVLRLSAHGAAAELSASLGRIARAFLDDFPENVFWDFDRLAGRLAHDPRGPRRFADDVVRLSRLYGRRSEIRFRYIHDFVYGFDWCRWVKKEPAGRAAIGPFDPMFLEYLERRAGELVALIAADDPKYGKLREPYRNPFGFSRDPADEERLHRALAERGLIPVAAWARDGVDRWQEDFAELRESLAESLAIQRGKAR